MEKKNNFMPLLIYSIKEKKNWVLLSTVIIFVTTLLIPYILRVRDGEGVFVLFGIVELFVLVFINCLVDNNFLHNESKLAYYNSKPITLNRHILINIVTNAAFAVYLLAVIALSIIFQGLDYDTFNAFKMFIPWLAAIILLASMSSILSGNTLMAGAMTIFNFYLPLIIYLVTMFIFTILENVVIGFSADSLMDYFANNIYRLDYIYFTKYMDYKSVDFVYILLLSIILIFISVLIRGFIKRRKNENTGFIVFNGFKYFVAVLACLIIPALFTISMYRSYGVASRLIISALLAVLSYYIIIAFIEKSFRISKSSIRVFALSMAIFAAIMGGTVVFSIQHKNFVPDPEDVKMVYVGSQQWSVSEIDQYFNGNHYNSHMEFSEWKANQNIITYEDIDNIKNITRLHKEILKDQTLYYKSDYYIPNECIITYWMKDGSRVIRNYKLTQINEYRKEHEAKDEIANKIMNSPEYKKQKYFYLYDEEYYSGRDLYAKLWDANGKGMVLSDINLNDLREVLKMDTDNLFIENEGSLIELMTFWRSHDQDYSLEIYEKDGSGNEKYFYEINLNDKYVNTLNYFKYKMSP